MGTYVGVTLEQAIAYGVATVRIVTKSRGRRDRRGTSRGRPRRDGVRRFRAERRCGDLNSGRAATRTSTRCLNVVSAHDKDAFVTVEEPKMLRGGLIASHDWRFGGPFTRWMKSRDRA